MPAVVVVVVVAAAGPPLRAFAGATAELPPLSVLRCFQFVACFWLDLRNALLPRRSGGLPRRVLAVDPAAADDGRSVW